MSAREKCAGNAGRLVAFLFLILFAWRPALAQTAPAQIAVPAVRTTIDGNSVDLFSGTFNYSVSDISIGSGSNALALSRTWNGNGWWLNVIGTINATTNSVGGIYTVTIGTSSESFTRTSSTNFTSNQGSGSTLSYSGGNYIYQTSGGATAAFVPTPGTGLYNANVANLSSLSYLDGRRTDFFYTSHAYCPEQVPDNCPVPKLTAYRLQSVRNNAGYQIKLTYGSNTLDDYVDLPPWLQLASVTTINAVQDFCDPTADICGSLSMSWPTATYTGFTTAQIRSMTDPINRTWSYTIDSNSNLTGIRWPLSSSDDIVIGYDSLHRVQTYHTAAGTWTYTYSDSGDVRTVTVTDPLSNVHTMTFSISLQQVKSDTNALGKTWNYTYDTSGRLTQAKAPEGNHSDFTYDSYGNVTDTVTTSKDGAQTIATHAAFDNCTSLPVACSSPTTTTDGLGAVTSYSYTGIGQPQTVTLPAPSSGAVQPQTRYAYGSYTASFKQSSGAGPTPSAYPISLPTRVSACRTAASCDTTADEHRTVIDYVAGFNLVPSYTSQGAGDGSLVATTSFNYDLYGNVIIVDGPLPGTDDRAVSSYDAARELLGVIGPDPDGSGPRKNRAISYQRNGNGWMVAVFQGTVNSYSDPLSGMTILARVESAYDALGRITLTGVRDPSTNNMLMMTQMGYDALSRVQCTAIRMNPSIYGALPGDACALGTTGSYGSDRITKTTYDPVGHVTDVQQAYGTADQIDYARTTFFSDNGKPLNLIDANGNITAYTYDGFDRPQSTHYPNPASGGSSTSDFVQVLAYDANSNATSYRLRDGNTVAMSYDALNRLTGRTGTTITGRSFQYDNLSEMTAAIINGGTNVTFGYDALGRMTTETSPIGTFIHGYDLAGRQTSLIWPDGFQITYNRFLTGEIGDLYENATGVHPLAMAYNDLGQRTIKAPLNARTTTYHYDGAGRLDAYSLAGLPGGTSSTWLTYNPDSQIQTRQTSDEQLSANVAYNVSRAYVANGLNQYTQAGSPGLSYDPLGNLTRLASTTYAYDGDNLLVGGSAGAGLSYDPLTRLAQVPDAGSTRFGYAGAMIAAEYDGGGTTQHRYVPGDAADEVLVQYEGSGYTRRYLATDEHGSVTEVSDDSGATLAVNTYDDWGIPARTNIGRYGYTGQTWLPSVQAWNYKARIYNPVLGRFQQSDPIGYADGPNWHRYAHNDPINGSDPSGLTCLAALGEGPDCGDGTYSTNPNPIPGSDCGDGTICVNGNRPQSTFSFIDFSSPFGFDKTDQAALAFLFEATFVNAYNLEFQSFLQDKADRQAEAQKPQKPLLNSLKSLAKSVVCSIPSFSVGGGADGYLGVGGSVSGSYNIDIAKGQFGISGSLAVGLGLGIDAGPSVGAGPNGSPIVSANIIASGGFAVPVAPGVNVGASGTYKLVGTNPGFSGAAISRAGTPLGYVNAGAGIGLSTPSLYHLGC